MATVDHRTQPHDITAAPHYYGDGTALPSHSTATVVCSCGITVSGPRSEVQRLADEHSRGV